ncbi:MAG: GntR family transcriptional regulator [Novosphingobium sp.]|nr:GntR family transcriptional regulator [Novosphingobium sp.]
MKLAEELARRIETHIREDGLGRGKALGSEPELTSRLGCSRWSLREALGLLARDGRVEIRRGRNGGIYVAEPGPEAAIRILWSYLEFVAVSDEEVLEARAVADRIVLTLATARLRLADVAALRASLDLESPEAGMEAGIVQFEALLAAARNPLATVLVKAIGQLGMNAILRSNLSDADLDETMRRVRRLRRAQIEAVIGGDLPGAIALEGRTLRQTRKLLRSARDRGARDRGEANPAGNRERAVRMLGTTRRYKRPELLMHEIAADAVAQGLPAGGRLGGEADLLAHYGVSRTVFREAVRALEHSGIVEMRSGRHSGLFVVAPDPTNTLAAARDRLIALDSRPGAIGEVLAGAVAGAIGSAPSAISDAASGGDFLSACVAMTRATGNRILALFVQLLADLYRQAGDEARLAPFAAPLAEARARGDTALLSRIVLNALAGQLSTR